MRSVLISIPIILLCAAARADLIQFSVSLDGAQAENCVGTGSAGTGSGTLTLDTTSGIVSYNITISGLGSPESAAHTHGPAAECAGAGVVYSLPPGSPKIATSPPLNAQEQVDMMAGLHYVMIHSVEFMNGEIRGQVRPISVPAVSTWGVATLVLLLMIVGTVVFKRVRLRA